ncbi:MAG: 2-succinyl-6-hydroxy-2,4-cyclohexadiene-carboxylate synthase [Firmicutes bacterium]|nr:2-succinyl-6-hydroxy-2,4-cyclohexadiene-carboxylate synthase [Bacillota bacterium]
MLIDVNGIQLNVEIEGEGAPLLLLHGFTGSTTSWQWIVPFLRNQYQVILIDLIGHGRSDAPADSTRYSMDYAVQDLLSVLDYLQLGKINLLGYSMGGRCALHFAVHFPQRVQTLILESSSPGIEDDLERKARCRSDEALAAFIEEQGLEAFVKKWTNLDLFATQQQLPEKIKNEVRLQRFQNKPQGLANSLRGMGTGVQQSLWSRLEQLDIPTLLLVGKKDAKFRQVGVSMDEMIPNSTLQIIPDAGHTIHLEKPMQFANAVKNFLSLHT